MATLLLLLLIAAPGGTPVEIETLDGKPMRGVIETWNPDGFSLRNDQGELESVSLERVLRIAPMTKDSAVAPSTEEANFRVTLADGSEVVVKELESSGDEIVLVAPHGLPDVGRFEVPVGAVHSVRRILDEQEPADRAGRLETQWNDIAQMESAGDLIVIRKGSADSLNYVAGAIGHVGKEKIGFTLDEQPIEVGRDRVFGWIYYRPPRDETASPATVVAQGEGFRLSANKVTWKPGQWVVETLHFDSLEISEEQLVSIDMSGGKVVYLSDLEPRRANFTPPPALALLGTQLDGYARDRGFFASRLLLEYPAESLDENLATSAGISRRVEFRKGLALRGGMELAYRLPAGFRQFRAVAGIDPQAKAAGPVVLRVVGDGEELLNQSVHADQPPQEITCRVEGIRQLEIFVGLESQNPLDNASGGALHLGSARLTR